jgi:acetyltransferase-like isoleucine patch superfamily enzyme
MSTVGKVGLAGGGTLPGWIGRIGSVVVRYVCLRGDKIKFMRWLGARIGEDCTIHIPVANLGSEPWLIEIGNRVALAEGVWLLTHDGSSRPFRHALPGSSPYGNRFGRILIHDECFVGTNSIVLPGVTIGPRSIVAAGSVVTRDVPPNTVVAGAPAHTICTLDEYLQKYTSEMVSIQARDRRALRRELTFRFWGEER